MGRAIECRRSTRHSSPSDLDTPLRNGAQAAEVAAAIKGMLPKGRLGRQLFTNLKVYKGPEHPHEAQNPEPMELPHCVFQGIYGGST